MERRSQGHHLTVDITEPTVTEGDPESAELPSTAFYFVNESSISSISTSLTELVIVTLVMLEE